MDSIKLAGSQTTLFWTLRIAGIRTHLLASLFDRRTFSTLWFNEDSSPVSGHARMMDVFNKIQKRACQTFCLSAAFSAFFFQHVFHVSNGFALFIKRCSVCANVFIHTSNCQTGNLNPGEMISHVRCWRMGVLCVEREILCESTRTKAGLRKQHAPRGAWRWGGVSCV